MATLTTLPRALLTAISQFLTLNEKLTQLSRLCRIVLPALSPAAFAHDRLTLSSAVLNACCWSPALWQQLSSVGALVVVESVASTEEARSSPLLQRLLSPSSTPSFSSFPRVRALLLDDIGDDAPQDLLARIAAAMRELEVLRLDLRWPYDVVPAARPRSFWSPLASLHSLQTLIVTQYEQKLEYSTFRFLCSLPLTHLDLTQFEIVRDLSTTREDEQPSVTGTWEVLRLPHSSDELLAAGDLVEAVLDRYGAGSIRSDAEAAHPRLRYVSVDTRRWPETAGRLVAMAYSLVSLELRGLHVLSDPLLLVDAATARPLLPHLRHLSIPSLSARPGDAPLTMEEAGNRSQVMAQLLLSYRHQLHGLGVRATTGSSCWPLLQVAFSCPALRRCELFRETSWIPEGGPHLAVRQAALRPDAEPPALPSLSHLHTLRFALRLSEAELICVLHACPVLLDLSVELLGARVPDALQLTRLISQHASPTLRLLRVCAKEPLDDDSNAAAVPTSPRAPLPPPSPPCFPALTAFRTDGRLGLWTAPALQQLVQLLVQAPLQHLDIESAPLSVLHHLAPLLQLRTLRTQASFSRVPPPALDIAFASSVFFHCTPFSTRQGLARLRLTGGRAELERRLLSPLIDGEEAEVSDERLLALAELTPKTWTAPCRFVFVKKRLYQGRDGREAYMHWLQQLNAPQDADNQSQQEMGSRSITATA